MGHFPAGASVQSFSHFGQLVKASDMQLFDWGSASANQAHYGQSTPPVIDFKRITVPTAMFVGTKDELGDLNDCRQTKSEMGSALIHYQEMAGGHDTFLIGKDMSYFETVKQLIQSHQN